MALPTFARQTIHIQDPGRRLVHGSEVVDWTNPGPKRPIDGCVVTPATTSEDNGNRTAVRTGYNVQLPPGTQVTDESKLWLPDGLDYGVVGDPLRVDSPTGSLDHIQLYAERWAG